MLFLFACQNLSSAPTAEPTAAAARVHRVFEAFDVPPPPGQRTLTLHAELPRQPVLGGPVEVFADGEPVAVGDLVDFGRDPPSLTVYLPESDAETVLEARGLTVR